jgi:hypothetical protein
MMTGLLLLASLQAEAAGLRLDWNKSAPVRYRAEVVISTPRGFRYLAPFNDNARALQTLVSTDLSCTGAPLGKGWEVSCAVERFSIQGTGDGSENEVLKKVFASYEEIMAKGVRLEMEVKADGTFRTFDMEGVDKGLARQNDVAEQLRQLMRRTTSAMALPLPKDGEGAKPWKSANIPMFYELHTMVGTSGMVDHVLKLDGNVGETIMIVGEGSGNVSTVESVGIGAYAMVGASQARFDPNMGLLAYSEFATTGNPGNQLGQSLTSAIYTLSGWVGRINADGTVEGLDGPRKLD